MIPARDTLPSIGFLTTCRGRLHHLQRTLPLMLAEQPDEVIVVDHDCPQGTAAWVEANHPSVRVVRIRDGQPFQLAHARNVGLAESRADILCVIDADILVSPGFVAWIRKAARRRGFFRHAADAAGRRDRETWGTLVCPRALLLEAGLYDEAYDGWGGEDDELYYRLRSKGAVEGFFPFAFVQAIRHGDQERFALYPGLDRRLQMLVNRVYLDAKKVLLAFSQPPGDLPLDLRLKLRRRARDAVFDPATNDRLKVQVRQRTMPLRDFGLDMSLTIEIGIDRLARQHADSENTDVARDDSATRR